MKRSEIVRLSLVRFGTSFLVVLIVGVLNRIMIAEFGISRTLVGLILSLLHLVTPLALYFGFLSDTKPIRHFRRLPYIFIGMLMCSAPLPFLPDVARGISNGEGAGLFISLGVVLVILIGFGITISTVALHALVVDRCPEDQRGEAMTLVWIITLSGFIFAAPIYSLLLPQYDQDTMRFLYAGTAILVLLLTIIGIWGQEKRRTAASQTSKPQRRFTEVFLALSLNPQARLLFLFIALADFFFFSQEYVLEAFGQEVFRLSVAHTTSFSLYLGMGILISMLAVNAIYTIMPKLSEKLVITVGCIVASLSFSMLALSSFTSAEALIMISVFSLGFGKGIYNVGIARVMVRVARNDLSGMIMGLWAVVGGFAIGIGELSGGAVVDFAARITGSVTLGYGILFIAEGAGLLICLFLIALFNPKDFHGHLEGRLPTAVAPEWM